jgi:hypothetical protein
MNWGYRIVLAFVCFITFMGYIATKAMRQNIDLVAKDYYQQEIQYQDQIKRIHNADELDIGLHFDYLADVKSAKIVFPDKHFNTAEVMFYCPSNAKKDFKITLKSTGDQTEFMVPLSKLSNGLWKVKILWTDGEKEFYKEQDFVI